MNITYFNRGYNEAMVWYQAYSVLVFIVEAIMVVAEVWTEALVIFNQRFGLGVS